MTRSELRAHGACRRVGRWLCASIVAVLLSVPAARAQQQLERRIAAVQGDAILHFASRPGVCGNGDGGISIHSSRASRSTINTGDDGWSYRCEPGPVLVRLSVVNGTVTRVRTHLGGWYDDTAGVTDLGGVGAREAVDYFLGLAREAESPVARKAILPAALADSVTVAPRLIELARDRARPVEVRKPALFWAGQVGEEGVLEPVRAMANDDSEDESLRKHAVFVLSQLPGDAGLSALVDIAQHGEGMPVRKQALFWLAQKDDPRVVALLTSILEK